MATFNYVVTAHKPTNVTHSLVACFTGPNTLNLIVSRCTRIEIYALEAQGLQLVLDVPLYCRIATMELWRPAGRTTDRLFISTERYEFCILAYDERRGEIVTEARGNVADRIGRPADAGQICAIEPESRMIGLHLYDGLLKVIPATASGTLMQESFNIRLEELQVIDLVFLHALPKPTIALLYQDNKEGRHLKTYEVHLREKDFADGPWAQANVEAGACILIPVKAGGVLVVGELAITYVHGTDFKTCHTPFTSFKSWEAIDETRFLLGDSNGGLHVLVVDAPDHGPVVGLVLERMGTTSQATTLTYLTDGITFIGSSFGDSQLVQLQQGEEEVIHELERWANIGPIVDFVVVDLERHGQGSLVTCSGGGKDGSLRIARVELPGIKGMWAAAANGLTYLILSFISETRVLAKEEEELGEVEVDGFDGEHATVNCAATPNGMVVQVTSVGVRMIDGATMSLKTQWTPPNGSAISMAAIEKDLVLLATSGTQLFLLDASGGDWVVLASVTMPHEVACLAICSSHAAPAPDGATDMQTDDDVQPAADAGLTIPPIAACGLWTDLSIRLLSLPTLAEVHHEALGGHVIPRSLCFAPFGEGVHLMCALGDGQMMTYSLVDAAVAASAAMSDDGTPAVHAPPTDAASCALANRKAVTIGTKPITLTPFHSHGTLHVFAASDRPTVLHASSSGKLLYSNVNLKTATHMTPFACDADAPDTLAIATEEALILGTVDEVRKLHIRSVSLHEQPRRIVHLEHVHAFALLTMAVEQNAEGDERERNFVRLLDETTFERHATFELGPMEAACSTLTLRVPPEQMQNAASPTPTLLVVGTAYARPDEPEPTAGRLLVFDVSDRTLELVHEHRAKGAVYSLEAIGANGLLAGVNNKLQLFEWSPSSAGSTPSLRLRAEHCGHILVLYIAVRGDFILVGDLMKSLSLYQCDQPAGTITELARDYNSHWMTSVAFLDDDTYLGAENSHNLFVARKNADAATDDDRGRLEIVGEFHLGEFVNRFRRGSLAMQVAEAGTAPLPTLLYGTVNGVLGLIATLPMEDFNLLTKVQTQLTKVIKGVGGFVHKEWRAFSNDRKTCDASHVLDGDVIEAFLALSPPEQQQVCAGLPGMSVEELTKRIEELARLH